MPNNRRIRRFKKAAQTAAQRYGIAYRHALRKLLQRSGRGTKTRTQQLRTIRVVVA